MLVPELGRHLSVCGIDDIPVMLKRDPGFWNVISIRETSTVRPSFKGAKKVHHAIFYDIEEPNAPAAEGFRAPTEEDIQLALSFVDSVPAEPILIHCRAGVSRSTGLAVVLMVRGLLERGRTPEAVDIVDRLLAIRRQAVPNVLVMRLGFQLCMPVERAEEFVRAISNDSRLMSNRFINPNRQ